MKRREISNASQVANRHIAIQVLTDCDVDVELVQDATLKTSTRLDPGEVDVVVSPAREIGPIGLVTNGRVKAPQNLRYTTRKRLDSAKNLDDIWKSRE